MSIVGSRSAAAGCSRGIWKSTLDAYTSFMAAGRIAGIAENLYLEDADYLYLVWCCLLGVSEIHLKFAYLT